MSFFSHTTHLSISAPTFVTARATTTIAPTALRILWQERMEPNDVEMIMESVELQSVEPKPKLYRLVGEGLGGTFVWPDEYVQNPALSLT